MKRLLVQSCVVGLLAGLGIVAVVQAQRGPSAAHAADPSSDDSRAPVVDPFGGAPQPFTPPGAARALPGPQDGIPDASQLQLRSPANSNAMTPPSGGYPNTDSRYNRAAPAGGRSDVIQASGDDSTSTGGTPSLSLPNTNTAAPRQLASPGGTPIRPDYRAADNRAQPASNETAATPAAAARNDAGPTTGSGRPGARDLEGRQAPSLEIEKVTPGEIQVGKTATFEIRVRNVGGNAAHDVIVTDEVPQGTQLQSTNPRAARGSRGELIWSLGTLDAGEEAAVRVEVLPTAEGEIGSVARVQFAAEASSRVVSTRPALSVEVNAPKEVLIGEPISLNIRVTNTGTGVATGVVVAEHVPETAEHPAGAELEYEVGELAPGESKDLNLSLTAVRPGAAANLLVARGDGQLQVEQRTPITVIAPGLKIAVDGPSKRLPDRPATYTVSVANPGTAPAEQVELITYLPPGMDFVEANNQGVYDENAHAVHWLLEELPAAQRGSVVLTAIPTEPGEHTLRVVGTARGGLTDEAREAISVEGVAALQFQVVDQVDPVELSGETTYEILVSNQGSKDATNVQVTALLPAEMKAISAEGPTRYEASGQQVRFEVLPRLAPKAETVFRIRVQGTAPGDLRMRVQLKSDDLTSPLTKEESTRVYADE